MTRAREFLNVFSIGRPLGVAAAMAGLAACSSGGSSALAPASAQNGAAARTQSAGCPATIVYVVSNGSHSIDIYNQGHLKAGPCGSITGLTAPQGLFADSKGDLWVADAFARQTYEFVPGMNTPALTLSDPNGEPNAVTVDEKSGTVYVTDYQNSASPQTLVEVYAKGSTTPTGTLSDPNARNGGFDALDNQGNLYVTFMTQSNKAQVDRWMGGTGTPKNLGLKLVSAGAIVTTASGTLAVCDPFAFRCGEFAPGSTKMSHVFAHMGRGATSGPIPDKPPFLHPDALALDRGEQHAYVAATSLTMWKYPGPANRPNHLPQVQIPVQGDAGQGIAVSPPSRPGAPY
jgi:hypothetical protein